MGTYLYLSQLFLGNSDTRLINCRIQIGLATKACGRGRSPNKIEESIVTVQGMTGPVCADQVEHAMLNQVPFRGTGGIMSNRDNQAEFICQTLQAHFPEFAPAAIGATAVGLDQQVSFVGIKDASQFHPPVPDGRDSKLGGIMRGAYPDIALIMSDVIDAIGNGFALSRVQKVVHIDLASLLSPFLAGLLKIADQFTLFGIHTDDRPTAAQISLSPTDNIPKLLVSMWRLLASDPLMVDPQGIIALLQQPADGWQANPICWLQGALDFSQRFVRPFQARHWITRRFLGHQFIQSRQ